ncbi:unnamed protein product [Nyctereutes procyonoides]|uniref:(raccoon dog) hypothetical protein n=1 Tax=Nyctereutes procyonoides TaxID=34880 RepID=A0A811ZXK8_NYCPR|nr:unnamed protein product [Nyctereutes procyonoides]
MIPAIMHIYNLLPMVNCNPEVDDPPSDHRQKVNSSLMSCPNAYVIHLASSHHKGILTSHTITRRVTTWEGNCFSLLEMPTLKKNAAMPSCCGFYPRCCVGIFLMKSQTYFACFYPAA